MPEKSRKLAGVKVILFDVDGTLTDPKVGITKSVAYALDAYGIHIKDLDSLCCFIGPPLKNSFMNYYGFTETRAAEAVNKFREYFKDTGIYENELYPGIGELLRGLKEKGLRLIVATSKPKVFACRVLEHFDIAQYFEMVCGSELDGTRSDKGEVIRYALQEAGITDLSTVIMVGDREHDVIGAREAGVECIGVLYGYGSREEFEKAGAAYIAETVEDLGRILL